MAAKGQIAKENVLKKLQEVFGEDWIGESNKKYYVWAKGETGREQIAFTLTSPKVEVSVVNAAQLDYGSGGLDFENMQSQPTIVTSEAAAEITEEEERNIEELLKKLGL